MPGADEHHSCCSATVLNPFDVIKPHVSEYTAAEIATLSSRLEKQLGPEYISSRQGPGGAKVHYLSADKCINLANEVFGFNGWSSSIQSVQIDFVDEAESGRISLGLSVTLRVTLRDGTYHEDIGYGHIENCKGKAPAFEKAKKEGTTDALKRALRNFGNLLGNCVYDKDYVAKVTKLKAGPTKWDPDNLHRHPDFAPRKESTLSAPSKLRASSPQPRVENHTELNEKSATACCEPCEDEFGSDDFDAVDFSVPGGGHPDEVVLAPNQSLDNSPACNISKEKFGEEIHYESKPTAPLPGPEPQVPIAWERTSIELQVPHQPTTAVSTSAPMKERAYSCTMSEVPSAGSLASAAAAHHPPVRFFAARAAEILQAQTGLSVPSRLQAFDPHLDSPSIRKTAGVDHTKSKAVTKDLMSAPPTPSPRTNGVQDQRTKSPDSKNEKHRKVGMPLGNGSPLLNRGAYKLPQIKRPTSLAAGGALTDVTLASVNMAGGMSDAKRQKMIDES